MTRVPECWGRAVHRVSSSTEVTGGQREPPGQHRCQGKWNKAGKVRAHLFPACTPHSHTLFPLEVSTVTTQSPTSHSPDTCSGSQSFAACSTAAIPAPSSQASLPGFVKLQAILPVLDGCLVIHVRVNDTHLCLYSSFLRFSLSAKFFLCMILCNSSLSLKLFLFTSLVGGEIEAQRDQEFCLRSHSSKDSTPGCDSSSEMSDPKAHVLTSTTHSYLVAHLYFQPLKFLSMSNLRLTKFKGPFLWSLRQSVLRREPERGFSDCKIIVPFHWTSLFLKRWFTSEMRINSRDFYESSLTCGPSIPGGPGRPLGPASPCSRNNGEKTKQNKTARMSVWSPCPESSASRPLTHALTDFPPASLSPAPPYRMSEQGCRWAAVHSWPSPTTNVAAGMRASPQGPPWPYLPLLCPCVESPLVSPRPGAEVSQVMYSTTVTKTKFPLFSLPFSLLCLLSLAFPGDLCHL